MRESFVRDQVMRLGSAFHRMLRRPLQKPPWSPPGVEAQDTQSASQTSALANFDNMVLEILIWCVETSARDGTPI